MPAVSTAINAIDRKLHRVVLNSDPDQFKTFAALSRQIASDKSTEFSYQRFGKTEYSGAEAIEAYVSFAREVGLLDGELQAARPKKEIRALENFQSWLGDLIMQYLDAENASVEQIQRAMIDLVTGSPSRLPTQENIRAKLDGPPSPRNFKFALKITALLRGGVLSLASRRLVLKDGIVED
jgi:hypothetical protein